MRKYAYLKEPLKCGDSGYIFKIMLYETGEGVYLFGYFSMDAVQSSYDLIYERTEDLYEEWNDLIDERGWIETEDPLPFCQHDAFIPLRVKGRETGEPEWGKYETLKDGEWVEFDPDRKAEDLDSLERWHFELNEKASNYLLDMVLKGKKRATSGSLTGYRLGNEKLPEEGELSIITDWDGVPRCVVRTTRVRIVPYKDITFDMAKLEGEDESLDSWKRNHERFFREEGKELGYDFSEDMEVVFEEFEVVEVID